MKPSHFFQTPCKSATEYASRAKKVLADCESYGYDFCEFYDSMKSTIKKAHLDCVKLYVSFLEGETCNLCQNDYTKIIYNALTNLSIELMTLCNYIPMAEGHKVFDSIFNCKYWWNRFNGVWIGDMKYEFGGIGTAKIPKIQHPRNVYNEKRNPLTYNGEVLL